MEPLLVVANCRAGVLSRAPSRITLEEYADEAGLDAEIVYTRTPVQLQTLLRERVVGKRARVAVAGGDGTVHRAVQVLVGTGVVLGIVPQGTANNFATALRLPRDLPSAFRVLAEGQEHAVSLGEADGEYFTEAAGAGIFADVLAATAGAHGIRNVLRALRVVIRAMVLNDPYRLSLELDGDRRREDVVSVTVANSFCLGYNIPIAPHARLTDEELDVVTIGPLTRREMLPYYRAIRAQTHLNLPKVRLERARDVKMSARHPITVHVDDRTFRRSPVRMRVQPDALRVLVDRT